MIVANANLDFRKVFSNLFYLLEKLLMKLLHSDMFSLSGDRYMLFGTAKSWGIQEIFSY